MRTRANEKMRNGALMLIALAMVLFSGLIATTPPSAHAATVEGYTLPSSITAKVGESRTLNLGMPKGELCNVGWCTSPSYVSTSGTECGSYWGKPACTTIKCLSAGTTYVHAEVKRFDKTTKRQIGRVMLTTKVTIGNASRQTTTRNPKQSTPSRSLVNLPSWVDTTLRSVSLSKTALSLTKGGSEQLGLNTTPRFGAFGQKATWTSSNTRVATVDSGGYVKAVGAGTATITVRLAGKKATCKVTVRTPSTRSGSGGSTRTSTGSKQGYIGVSSAYTALNSFRASNSRGALRKNAALERTAKVRAKELVTKFSHTRPNGRRPRT